MRFIGPGEVAKYLETRNARFRHGVDGLKTVFMLISRFDLIAQSILCMMGNGLNTALTPASDGQVIIPGAIGTYALGLCPHCCHDYTHE
jgi:hypothetical protein